MSVIAILTALPDALGYAARGWRVLPVAAGGKRPLLPAWQKAASDDEETVAGWWDRWPDANVGVLLGEASGIVDVEFDDDAGRETADRVLGEAFTPTFSSGRSVHRLFLWRDDLPRKAKVVVRGLEVRGCGPGAQSVFPPSLHPSGKRYAWLTGLSPDDVDVQPIPDEVLAWIWNDDGEPTASNGAERRPGRTLGKGGRRGRRRQPQRLARQRRRQAAAGDARPGRRRGAVGRQAGAGLHQRRLPPAVAGVRGRFRLRVHPSSGTPPARGSGRPRRRRPTRRGTSSTWKRRSRRPAAGGWGSLASKS